MISFVKVINISGSYLSTCIHAVLYLSKHSHLSKMPIISLKTNTLLTLAMAFNDNAPNCTVCSKWFSQNATVVQIKNPQE